MKRIVMLTALAAMMAAAMALSGVAQAKPISDSPDAKCVKLAIKTLGPSFNPSNYTFHGGTEGNDVFTGTAGQPEVFCGFGGDDSIGTLDAGDIFLSGAGNDRVNVNYGTFYGGEGIDRVVVDNYGTFYGGADIDRVHNNFGFFYGGGGTDSVDVNTGTGTFYGGEGDDIVVRNAGIFYGEEGNDQVSDNSGIFYGGEGSDFVGTNNGTFVQD